MKKLSTLMLTFILCLSMFSCGRAKENAEVSGNPDNFYNTNVAENVDENTDNSENPDAVSSDSEAALVGEWAKEDGSNGFVLLASGNYLGVSRLSDAVMYDSAIVSGLWEVDHGYLIVYKETYSSYKSAWVYKVIDDNTLERNGDIYKKS